ncbi:hypothetical protein H9L17_14420 [Thermomonas brevis]|uniref:Uncharacterized protein n=1 Tax=Thermomonas brevis TaxID=215691 RepID=A0A7G9QY43_9GAMM|nr:hypothetical protein [Thermomonas brevis]QNN48268.1 hypothetical protein H9L17_14420 [Thermomonas brevis]
MISIRSTLIAGGAPAGTVKSDAIPFRPDAVVSLPEAGGVLAAALLLLAAFYGLAWYARRAGWLGRWMGGGPRLPTMRGSWRFWSVSS